MNVSKVTYLTLALLVLSLDSCEFGANAVDGSALRAGEGTIFTYEDRSNEFGLFTPASQIGQEMEIKFLSKMAAIGGRDSVFGFQSSLTGELMFSDVRDGQLSIYFQANRDFETPIAHNGEWIHIPAPGEPDHSTTIADSVFSFDREFTRFVRRTLTVAPMEQYQFYVDGYYFTARKVKVTSDYHFDEYSDPGEQDHDEQELTFLVDMGVIAERVVTDPSGFTGTSFIMNGIRFK